MRVSPSRSRVAGLVIALGVGLPLAVSVAAGAEPGGVELEPVVRPDLSRFEEPDRRQLEAARSALDALAAAPDAGAAELARGFGELGRLYFLYDLGEAAEAALRNAVARSPEGDPEAFDWHYYLGALYQRDGRLAEARERLLRAAELRPGDLATRIRLGRAELDAGLLEAAGESFRAALERDPQSAAALVGVGRIAYQEGRLAEAIERFEQALALDPRADSIHHLLGLAHRNAGDHERALEHLARNRGGAVGFPDPLVDGLTTLLRGAAVHLDRGNRALEAGDHARAVEAYLRAAEVAPENPLIHHNLGLALLRSGRRAEGIARLERAVALDPGYRNAHYNLGAAFAEDELWAAAARHYGRAWRADPLDLSAHLDWAIALQRSGRQDEAERELSAVLEEAAGREEGLAGRAHLELAPLLEARSEGAQALAHYRAAAERLPEESEAWSRLAAALARAGDLASAAAAYQAAIRLDPADPGLRFGLAMALILGGRHAEAGEALELAVAERPGAEVLPLAHLLARLLATAPDPSVRDGARAVALAQEVFRAAPAPEHAETLAMAFAEAGELERAVEWQRRVVARAEAAGAPAPVLETLRRRLARYQRGEPERSPWEGSS